MTKPLNIWLFRDGENLPIDQDVKKLRMWRLADALIKRGHTVTWWASSFDHFHKKSSDTGKLEEHILTLQVAQFRETLSQNAARLYKEKFSSRVIYENYARLVEETYTKAHV